MRPGSSRERVARPPRKLEEGRLVGREAETASRDRPGTKPGILCGARRRRSVQSWAALRPGSLSQWALGLLLPSEALQIPPLTTSTFGPFPRAPRGLQRI